MKVLMNRIRKIIRKTSIFTFVLSATHFGNSTFAQFGDVGSVPDLQGRILQEFGGCVTGTCPTPGATSGTNADLDKVYRSIALSVLCRIKLPGYPDNAGTGDPISPNPFPQGKQAASLAAAQEIVDAWKAATDAERKALCKTRDHFWNECRLFVEVPPPGHWNPKPSHYPKAPGGNWALTHIANGTYTCSGYFSAGGAEWCRHCTPTVPTVRHPGW